MIIIYIIIAIRIITDCIYFPKKVRFDTLDTIMPRRGLTYFEQHFMFSNRLAALVMGLNPHSNLKNQLFLICGVTIYVIPIIVHQVKDSFLFLWMIITYIIIGYFGIIITLIIFFKSMHSKRGILCRITIKCLYYLLSTLINIFLHGIHKRVLWL